MCNFLHIFILFLLIIFLRDIMFKNIDENIKYIKEINHESTDINVREFKIGSKRVCYINLESTSSDDKISNFLMKNVDLMINFNSKKIFNNLFNDLKNQIPNSKLKIIDSDLFYYLASGFTLIFVDKIDKCIAIETKANLDRSVGEPTTELIVRGPKDSFNENYNVNIGLIRKRIKDNNLFFDEIVVGKRTRTKIAISYINDIADKNLVSKIKKRLEYIDIDGIIDSGNLKSFICPKLRSAFPFIKDTERPDIICQSLLQGKVCIIVENSPFVLVFPAFLIDYFKVSQDYYEKSVNANFTRILRITAFILTIIVPALYVAIMTFNAEVIPDSLLLSLAMQREGVPFSTVAEVMILSIAFEILRESDIRMPAIMGASISIVGALVLGDAAVNAGIVSPFGVIIVAVTAICGLIFSDVDFINATRWWRFIFLIGAIFLGLLGIVSIGAIFVVHIASLEVLDIPYSYPLAPIDQDEDVLVKPAKANFFRGKLLTKNHIKMRDHHEK